MTRLYLRTYEIPKNQYKHILTKGEGLYTLTSFSLAEDLEQIILTIKILNAGGEV